MTKPKKRVKPTRGRPPKALPRKPDNTPYTPEEVAQILVSTSPQQLDSWRKNRGENRK